LLGGCVGPVFTLPLEAVEFWTRAINALDFADIHARDDEALVYGFFCDVAATKG